jgi:hypothetical protein
MLSHSCRGPIEFCVDSTALRAMHHTPHTYPVSVYPKFLLSPKHVSMFTHVTCSVLSLRSSCYNRMCTCIDSTTGYVRGTATPLPRTPTLSARIRSVCSPHIYTACMFTSHVQCVFAWLSSQSHPNTRTP